MIRDYVKFGVLLAIMILPTFLRRVIAGVTTPVE